MGLLSIADLSSLDSGVGSESFRPITRTAGTLLPYHRVLSQASLLDDLHEKGERVVITGKDFDLQDSARFQEISDPEIHEESRR